MNSKIFWTIIIWFLLLFLNSCNQASEISENQSMVDMEIEVIEEIQEPVEIVDMSTLQISYTDPIWDGITVPEGQWCSMFEWNGSTPELLIENIPDGTQVITIAYSDRSSAENDNGGHGIVGINIANWNNSVIVESIAGESFDLPDNMFVVEVSHSAKSNGWAYLPPCSGWSGNEYYISLKALDSKDIEIANELASWEIEMWIY